MQAVILREIGPAEALRVESAPGPGVGSGDAIVRLDAAALNHRDVWIRKGMYASIRLPAILGSDGTGIIEACGPGVDPAWRGRTVVIDPGLAWDDDPRAAGPDFRILGMPDDGTYATHIRVPATNLHPRPEHLSAPEAAALPLAGLTAYRALFTRAALRPGETLLITGIGGGVSALALQLAKAAGARVFVTSRDGEKLRRAAALGADGGALVTEDDWAKSLARMIGGGGPDVVLDSIGGATFGACVNLVRRGGRIVTYGATTGPPEKLELTKIFWKQIDILGTSMGSSSEFADLVAFVAEHRIRPVVDRVFPLAEAAEAHRLMETSGQFGKIVLDTSA